jgi:hypothetical protein
MENNNSTSNINPMVFVILAGAGIILYFGDKIFSKLTGDTPEERAEKEQIKKVLNADVFNDTFEKFWQKLYNFAKQKNKGLYVKTFFEMAGYPYWDNNAKSKIVKQAKQIYDAKATWGTVLATFGFIKDQDNVVLGILRNCPSQIYISALQETFYNLYGKSFIDYLDSFMDADHVARIEDIIKSKPLY